LLGIMRRLARLVNRDREFRELAEEHGGRSLLLEVYDEKGRNFMHFKMGPRGIQINPIDMRSTLTARCNVDVLLDILERKYTPQFAVSKRLMELEAEDGDWFYHYVVITTYLEKMIEKIWGG